jgi:hypothetical protein
MYTDEVLNRSVVQVLCRWTLPPWRGLHLVSREYGIISFTDSTSSHEPLRSIPSKPAKEPNHRTNPTLPCKFYNSATGCTNGSTCTFLHTYVVPSTAPLVAYPRPWRTRPCRHYQVGRCTLGNACHFAHVYEGKVEESDSEDEDDVEIVSLVLGEG